MTVRTKQQGHFLSITIFADTAAIAASFLTAYLFRFTAGIIPIRGNIPDFAEYARTLIVIIPVYLWFFRSYGLYDPRRNIRRIEEIFKVIKAISFAVVFLMALTFFYRTLSYSRVYLVILWSLSVLFVSETRYLIIQWHYHQRRQRKDLAEVLLIGMNRNTRHIIQWAKNNSHYGQDVIGILASDSSAIGKHLEGVEILGCSKDCEELITKLSPQLVILLDTSFSRERITDLVAHCEDRMIEFKIGADFYGLLSRNVDVEYVSTVPLLGFRSLPLDDFWNRISKRLFDIATSFVMIVLSAPVTLLTIILIKLSDGGPVFYVQERVGRDEVVFNVFKFRTMKVDAEKTTGPVWAKPNDKRRTVLGNFLRRWNIDELPQLFNVLRGDMSLVGPRPERPHFVSQFRSSIPRYMSRHKIKSGLTGWAQVNGYRGNTSIQERLKYDLYYMENWSLIFDVEILLMTAFAFKNAY